MKRKIAILTGGDSSEIEISLKSSKRLLEAIDIERFEPYCLYMEGNAWHVLDEPSWKIDKNDFSVKTDHGSLRFEVILFSIHGAPAENGKLQAYFDLVGQKYVGCDSLCSAISFNKHVCNTFLQATNLNIAKSKVLYKKASFEAEQILSELKLPVFVKPNEAGSSFGVSKVTRVEELKAAIEKAFSEDDSILVEEFIDGLEVTNGIFKVGNKTTVLPITEVIPKNDFFDFEAKYNAEKAEEITPARISEKLTSKIQDYTLMVYEALKCEGIVRVDYIIQRDKVYFLEVNTIPGMTATSFIPQQFEAAGISFDETVNQLIEDKL